ncbi:MAG: ribbon-helix-helix protein, CopG family [Alphaproteobacteria bacterium]|nr:ribbon-helix-helix protein, CopG family [Alphaproteobacteria bacterium]MBU2378065.1 ribbon-helix-helix protein, CopG family [Alphaproteobacteria bacterium]
MTRNLTLAIDDDLLDKVRVLAAMKRTSVNEMVRGFLTRLVQQETSKDEAREALLKLIDESEGRMGDYKFNRADAYSGEPRFDREY